MTSRSYGAPRGMRLRVLGLNDLVRQVDTANDPLAKVGPLQEARTGLTMWLGSIPPPATSASIGVNSE